MGWMVELGRIDIAVEVSQLSSFLAMPRQGHLVNALHIISYLNIKNNSRLVLVPSYPGIDMSEFNSNENWAPRITMSSAGLSAPLSMTRRLCAIVKII